MRLGQFARKYDIRVQDLISYLEGDAKEEIHSNTKLNEEAEADILDFFGIEPEVEASQTIEEPPIESESPEQEPEEELAAKSKTKQSSKKKEDVPEEEINWDAHESNYEDQHGASTVPETPEADIAAVDGEIVEASSRKEAQEKQSVKVIVEEVFEEKPEAPKEDEVIQTDKLLEMLESEEAPADLDKIKLIKAPKKELSGLKVLGKVELPEPPKKKEKPEEKEEEESQIVTEKDLRDYRYPKRKKRQPLTPEQKEERRLKAKRKKEAFEARQEKRKKEKEAQKLKELRQAHYKQRLEQQQTSKKAKQKAKHQTQVPSTKQAAVHDSRPKPKTMLGRVWRWLNSH